MAMSTGQNAPSKNVLLSQKKRKKKEKTAKCAINMNIKI
jgi:hypothetical protein